MKARSTERICNSVLQLCEIHFRLLQNLQIRVRIFPQHKKLLIVSLGVCTHPGCVLLIGDGYLRRLATTNNIEVHGFLWVIDQIHQHRLSAAKVLCDALRLLAGDPVVRPPRKELAAYLKRYEGLR